MSYSDRHQWAGAEIDTDSSGDKELPFSFLNRVVIHKIGFRVTNTDAGDVVLTFEDRIGASTDTTIEVITVPGAANDGITYYTELATPYVLGVGHTVNVAHATGSGAEPTGYPLIEYSLLDQNLSEVAATLAVESA